MTILPYYRKFVKILTHPLTVILGLYVVSIYLIKPFGEFVVNDDWAYSRQVEAFTQGHFGISSFITASFLLQGLLGALWSAIFGFSLHNLRVLMLVNTFALGLVTFLVLKYLGVKNRHISLALVCVVFNPLVYTLSMSFMSDNLFLTFQVLALLFYTKALKESRTGIYGTLAAGCAFLVRQVAVVPLAAYLVVTLFAQGRSASERVKLVLVNVIGFAPFVVVFMVWPRYSLPGIGGLGGLNGYIASVDDFTRLLPRVLYGLVYLAIFCGPLVVALQSKLSSLQKLVLSVVGVALALLIFKNDVFGVGGILSLEGLNIRSDYSFGLTLLDNIIVKIVFSLVLSFITIKLVKAVFLGTGAYMSLPKLDRVSVMLLMSTFGNLALILAGNDFYDRHLLPAFVCFLLFVCYQFFVSDNAPSGSMLPAILFVVGFCVFSVLLQYEYLQPTKLMWQQATKITIDQYISPQRIYVSGPYVKYYNAMESRDYTGLVAGEPNGGYLCYARKFSITEALSPSYYFISYLDTKLEKRIGRPEPAGSRKKTDIPSARKNTEFFIYQEEYVSPINNLLGKKAYVVSWCAPLVAP